MRELTKKLSMLILTLLLVVGSVHAVHAEEAGAHVTLTDYPANTDKATVKVYDVEPGLTVTAYQIVKATYDESGSNFRGFVAKEPLLIETDTNADGTIDNENDGNHVVNLQDPKSEEITKIASLINAEEIEGEDFIFTENTDKFVLSYANGVYSADLAPGYYIIKVSGLTKDNEKIYNPMLAGVYYGVDVDGEIKTVDTMVEYETEDDASTKERTYVLYEYDAVVDANGNVKPEYVQIPGDETATREVKKQDGTKETITYTKYRKVINLTNDQIDAGYALPVNQEDPRYWNLSGTDLYAKSSPVEIEKTVYDNIDGDVATNRDKNEDALTNDKHGDHHDIGDTVTFHAKVDIPDYSDEYEQLVYKITDTLEKDKLAFRGFDGKEVTEGITWLSFVIGDATVADTEYSTGIRYTVNISKLNTDKFIDYNGNEIEDTDKTTEGYKITYTADNEFVLELNEAAIRAHGGEKIYLEYYAELLEGADQNFNENTNEIEVEFVNDPTTNNDGTPKTTKKKDITFHYTFELDGQLDSEDHEQGGSKQGTQSGHELAKVDEFFNEDSNRKITYTRQNGTTGTATLCLDTEDENYGKYVDDETNQVAIDWDTPQFTEESWTKDVVKNGLAGAEFTLTPYKADANGKVNTVNETAKTNNKDNLITVTNEGGRLNFKGLDAGYYVLEETKAPKGYSKNPNKTVVFIDAKFYEENTYFEGEYTPSEDDYPGVDYDLVDENGTLVCKQIQFHKGELKSYEVKRKQLTPAEFDQVKDDLSTITEWGETTEYVESRTIDNGVVDYGVTTTVTGAAATFIKNTKIPVLPSTGGIGTYLFTAVGVSILAVASFMLISRKKEQN